MSNIRPRYTRCERKQANRICLGPLARVGLNFDRLSPTARKLADEVGISWPSFNPFQSIVARSLELVHAYEEALAILRDYQPARPHRVEYSYQSGCRMRRNGSPTWFALSSLRRGRRWKDPRGQNRASHVAEPGTNRSRPAAMGTARAE